VRSEDEARLAAALDDLLGQPSAADELERARLSGELARAGEVLRARAFRRPRDEDRFVASVLARTTRMDLSWRGDLRLWSDFLRARLKASPALRLVAASLALHLVAAPALAWWILREPPAEPTFTLHVELPSELPFVDELPATEEPLDELLSLARAREARENERATLRHGLLAGAPGLPELDGSPSEPLLAGLAAHLEALRTRRAPAMLPSAGESLLARALHLELALDRLWLSGADEDVARPLALELERELAAHPPGHAPHFAASALRRAWCEGLLEQEPGPAPQPFSAGWFEALARAADEAGDEGAGPIRSWCALAWPK